MFRRRAEPKQRVSITIDDAPVTAAAGDSVAAALLAAGKGDYRRSGVGGGAQAPFCLIGNCFDCLVEIDGVPNRQGCLVTVAEGMAVRRQQGRVRVSP
ncbi:MAG: (2Fe-2S)-binding protein [Alphaproteobacteria bacterium]|jgi:predicted molibdopterin-dependent oxidoreductase YjgC|nr:(2Fe-2S)-binding protein [Alphaproteobacteria bacterium]